MERSVKEHCSLLGFQGDELVGISLHSVREVQAAPGAAAGSDLVDIPLIQDYQQGEGEWLIIYSPFPAEIDAAPFESRAARKLSVFWQTLTHDFAALVPGARKVLFVELGGVAPQFQK